MENLVGDNLPSAEKIAAMLKKCIELRTEVSKLGIVLSPMIHWSIKPPKS